MRTRNSTATLPAVMIRRDAVDGRQNHWRLATGDCWRAGESAQKQKNPNKARILYHSNKPFENHSNGPSKIKIRVCFIVLLLWYGKPSYIPLVVVFFHYACLSEAPGWASAPSLGTNSLLLGPTSSVVRLPDEFSAAGPWVLRPCTGNVGSCG